MKRLKQFAIIGAIILAALTPVIGTRAAPAPVPVNPGTTGLVSWWSLDETSGIRYDAHGSNHLTDNNTVGYAAGKVGGNAANFVRANTEHLAVADNASISTGDIDFTIGAWVYLNNIADTQAIMTKWVAGQREYLFVYHGYYSAFRFNVSYDGTNATAGVSPSGSVALNTWYFVVAWHNATANTINISVNDGTPASLSTSSGVYDSTTALRLGSSEDAASQYLDGRIDAAFMYKRVLSADERAWLYNAGAGRSYSEINPPTPTPTNTSLPPTATFTPTNTSLPPTATFTPTNTSLPPTATFTPTNTSLPPTATFTPTNTPLPPTPTNTALPPTNTPLPPTPTNTPDPGATSTPLPLPTMRWEPSISYGEYAIVGSNMVLILLFVVGGMIAFVLTVVEKRRRP